MNHKHVNAGHPATPFEAFRQLVYTYGVDELAPAMGCRPGTLYNKADADDDTHHQPTLRDVVLTAKLTGDLRVIDSLNELFGRAAFDVRPLSGVSDAALLELVTLMGDESGQFHGALHQLLMAKTVDAFAVRLVRSEAFDLIAALMTLVTRVEGLVDE